ncbi:sulfotransferase [Salinibacter altiplanensis]|uniref:sulfotransferase n=1 Tax=Salinibacter altiplanensis TaxID=1803181 RepID=UPI000C9FF0E9|nr:sulfotransferase [Salinibacter altiplanensis]
MTFEDRYGWLDRLLHRTAFRAGTAQHALSDVEEILYRDTLDGISIDDPVFITALPRSGTTILLRLLWNTGRFAAHTYQDMPFLLCPLFWDRFSAQFDGGTETTERAHGDGLEVSGKSPEAFEEMIWKHFWPDAYRGDHIQPWSADDHEPAFDAFYESHMCKVVAVRRDSPSADLRYLSKNNLNIARLRALPRPLQSGTVLIPFRAPLQQAASMLRQHERFLQLHDDDDFVREYMEAIGHHEFGKGLCPINFGGWVDDAPEPTRLAFWVQYWIAAYQHVLAHTDEDTILLSYDRLVDEPHTALSRLSGLLSLKTPFLSDQADQLRPPRSHSVDTTTLSPETRQRASALHEKLKQRALSQSR